MDIHAEGLVNVLGDLGVYYVASVYCEIGELIVGRLLGVFIYDGVSVVWVYFCGVEWESAEGSFGVEESGIFWVVDLLRSNGRLLGGNSQHSIGIRLLSLYFPYIINPNRHYSTTSLKLHLTYLRQSIQIISPLLVTWCLLLKLRPIPQI